MTQVNSTISTRTAQPIPDGNRLFPVFLKLEQLRVALIGGGAVALEKLNALLGNAPDTHIVLTATHISPDIQALTARYPNLKTVVKAWEPQDLDGADLAIVAVNDRALSADVAAEARRRGILVNVADTPDLCDFYLGSIVRKGNLKLAISTNGKSPTVAKRLRETLDAALPAELDDVLDNMERIRGKLNGNFHEKVRRLNEVTRVLAVEDESAEKARKWRRVATRSLILFGAMLLGHFFFSYIPFREIGSSITELSGGLDSNFKWMLLAGLLAQLVDGALGMGYGLVSVSILLSTGISPAAISGSIHTAEMFASGASGYSHYRFGNVNMRMFRALVIPGIIGAIAGAVLLWALENLGETGSQVVRSVLACYTLLLGVRMIVNAFRNHLVRKQFRHYSLLAGAGGFLDSFGGGGWGPLVTSTLLNKGRTPRYVIGTVSLTEFFVTLASAITFFVLLGVSHWQATLGLIVGGLIAAPIAAKLVGKMPRKISFLLIGVLVIIWSIRLIIRYM